MISRLLGSAARRVSPSKVNKYARAAEGVVSPLRSLLFRLVGSNASKKKYLEFGSGTSISALLQPLGVWPRPHPVAGPRP